MVQAETEPAWKIPESVLVVIHTPALDVLLLRRAGVTGDFWQSVTGSRRTLAEPLEDTARREVREETGLDAAALDLRLSDWHMENVFVIDPRWGHRFAPGVTENVEHVYDLEVPADVPIRIDPREHTDFMWLPWQEAAARCFSWTNAAACRRLPERAGRRKPC